MIANFDNVENVSYDFRIHVEYSFKDGLKFSLIDDETGEIVKVDPSLSVLLNDINIYINNNIFPQLRAF